MQKGTKGFTDDESNEEFNPMRLFLNSRLIYVAVLLSVASFSSSEDSYAQATSPEFKADPPASILTPNNN